MNKLRCPKTLMLLVATVLCFGLTTFAQDNSQGGAGGRGFGRGQGRGRGGRGRGDSDLPPQPTAPTGPAKPIKPMAGEQFFIVASIDQNRQELLLKRPTEVTTLLKTTDKTEYLDDQGRTLTLADFRAGDTVWVASSGGASAAEPTATRIRKGQMTVAELHKTYLDYPEIQ